MVTNFVEPPVLGLYESIFGVTSVKFLTGVSSTCLSAQQGAVRFRHIGGAFHDHRTTLRAERDPDIDAVMSPIDRRSLYPPISTVFFSLNENRYS